MSVKLFRKKDYINEKKQRIIKQQSKYNPWGELDGSNEIKVIALKEIIKEMLDMSNVTLLDVSCALKLDVDVIERLIE